MPAQTRFYATGSNGVSYYRCESPARSIGAGLLLLENDGTVLGEIPCKKTPHTHVVSMPFSKEKYNIVDRFIEQGGAVIVDIDDWLRSFVDKEDHRLSHLYTEEAIERHESYIAKAHLVTTPSEWIAERVREELNPRVRVIPNAIDMWRWRQFDRMPYPDHLVTFGFCGGTGHEAVMRRIAPIIERVLDENESAAFVLMGHSLEEIVPERLHPRCLRPPWMGLDQYPAMLRLCDILIGPTDDTDFYRSKSNLRCLEAWASKAAFIGGRETYGSTILDSVNGISVAHDDEMYEVLTRLIRDKEQREYLAFCGHAKMLSHHQTTNTANDWRKAIRLARRVPV